MTRALVTQLVEVLESTTYNGPKMGKAIKAAREYLATEQSQSVEPFAYFNLGTEYHTRGKIAFHKEPTRNLETRWWGPDTPLYTRSVPQQVAVPEGYVLVPIEPTEKMIVDLMCTGLRHAEYKPGCDPTIAHMAQGYTAMIAAATQGEKP